ncbi:MAG: fibronectin type III domain-containing protein [Actinomycetota bacterium]|nr:fibronectin type III domain-containing protein [Actinomycetota bacterium]
MRRRLLLILLAVATSLSWATFAVAPATAQILPDDPRAGLIYDGLRQASGGLCGGAYEAILDAWVDPSMKEVICTHGPDPAPEGVDVRDDRGPDPAAELAFPSAATAAEGGAVPCYGNGSDGFRVQLIYARSTSRSDRFSSYEASFRAWAARMDRVVRDSAAETGGVRHIRFVTDSACNPVIERVVLSSSAMSSFSSMVSELHSKGYARTDRKYMVWADTNVYCGISELYVDDSPDATPGRNYNNGHPRVQGAIGRVDNGCWGLQNLVEAHELLHLLGGVQPTAPHGTPGYHCLDESDRLCYADGSGGGSVRQVCPSWHEALYDCNHDDYFSTAPLPGSYLSTHWNTASSAFLSSQAPAGPVVPTTSPPPAPPATTTVPPPPTTTTTATSQPPPTTTTSTAPPAATTTVAPPATTVPPPPPPPPQPATGVPSAPQGLRATQPTVGVGVQLAWQPPASGPVTGYRVYRGTSPYSQTFLADVGNVFGFVDATAGRTLFYYRVTAYNAAGEGASSNLTGMIGTAPTPAGTVREDVDRRLVVSDLRSLAPWAFRWA